MAGGDCLPDGCPVSGGFLIYQPSRAANSFFLGAFALLVPVVLTLGYRFKTLLFASSLATALLLQVVGFTGRLLLSGNTASRAYFAIFLLGNLLGSTFVAASLFIVLPHVVSIYGPKASSVFVPRRLGLLLLSLVLVTTVLEIIGAALTAFSDIKITLSSAILAAGLAAQAISLSLFVGTHCWITIRLASERTKVDLRHARVYRSSRFKRFFLVLQIITILLLGHTIYRIAEMATGLDGVLFQSETAFTAVDGALFLFICILLTIFQPGAAFGKAWSLTSSRRICRVKGRTRKHKLRSSPLPSPSSTMVGSYDSNRSPRHPPGSGFNSKTTTPTSAGFGYGGAGSAMPLRDSTMATTVRNSPTTQTTTQQPSPIATTQKNSPTFWKEKLQLQYQMQQQESKAQGGDNAASQAPSKSHSSTRGRLVDRDSLW